jgi:membrane protein DedA with SNARE-associated domain
MEMVWDLFHHIYDVEFFVFGGIFWVLLTTLAGYFLGRVIPNIQEHIHVIVIVIGLSLLPAGIKIAVEKLKVRS